MKKNVSRVSTPRIGSKRGPASGISIDGKFAQQQNDGENFRVCTISGNQVRVWGGAGSGALSFEIVAALRAIIKRVRPTFPIALMADYHPAELGVVGSVVVSSEHIVPDIIGGDCGCGVYATRLLLTADALTREQLQELLRTVLKCVPVGSAQNAKVAPEFEQLPVWQLLQARPFVSAHDIRKLRHQLGSLGGGNHFIELATDSEQSVWLLVHSGSRYLGGLLRRYYANRSVPLDSLDASEYLGSQSAVLEFASISRREMAKRVRTCLEGIVGNQVESEEQSIDMVHNYIRISEQSGLPVAIHRKGACSAKEGELGVIPGSMGTGSFIVTGRGCSASYYSSSHGAGRVLARGAAFKAITAKELHRQMEGVVWSESQMLRDEAPKAYKDIDSVIAAQRDLVRVIHRLQPILSIKGER